MPIRAGNVALLNKPVTSYLLFNKAGKNENKLFGG